MSNYSRGAGRERQAQERKEQNGWVVTRGAGSKGPYDLHCSKAGFQTELVQVKGDRRSPFASFGPKERRALLDAAEMAGALAMLCWWPPDRKGPRWLPPAGWP